MLTSNADMNDYVTPGNYFCVSNVVAETLSNCPFTHAFNLKVEFSNGAGLPCQIYREYDTGRIAYRVQPSSSSSSWSQYVYFSDDATLNQVSEYTVPKPEDNDDISYGDPCYIYVKKSGRFVNIQLNIFGTVYNTSGFITLFTLNEGYRPISGVIHNYISQGGIPMLLNITTSGNVQIHCPDNTITNSWIIRQCITFPCAA